MSNVVTALSAVMKELPGIEKLTPAQRRERGMPSDSGVGYAYRGIDQITGEAQKLMANHGVVISPHRVIAMDSDIEKGGKPWTRTTSTVTWRVYGPGGLTDFLECETRGIGDDNSDKSENKAFTQAFKNLLLKLLCIGDPSDDSEVTNAPPQSAAAGPQVVTAPPPKYPGSGEYLRQLGFDAKGLSDVKAWATGKGIEWGALALAAKKQEITSIEAFWEFAEHGEVAA